VTTSGILSTGVCAIATKAAAGLVAAAVVTAYVTRGSEAHSRVAHVLDAFRALGRCPRTAAQMLGWIGLATAGRILGATAIASAFGISRPLAAALLIIPALELAGTLPLTPGNIGVASAAIVFALKAHGVEGDTALVTGIAFSAVETLTSIAFGVGSALYLLGGADAGFFRRYALAGVSLAGCLAVGAAFGATVLVPLV
jgi:hypothetical protein